jgi:hypothetical protein
MRATQKIPAQKPDHKKDFRRFEPSEVFFYFLAPGDSSIRSAMARSPVSGVSKSRNTFETSAG